MSESGEGEKCSRCQQVLPRSAFARNKPMRDCLQAYCRECSSGHYRQRQEAKGLSVRTRVPVPREESYLRRTYGLAGAQ